MYSLRQGCAYLAQKNGSNELIKKSGDGIDSLSMMKYFQKMVEPFDNPSEMPTPATASSSTSSEPSSVSSSGESNLEDIQKLNDTFDSKMNSYSSAIAEYNKEILKANNFFVIKVRTLTPINSCFNCDASLGGTDCSAMGVSNSNGEIRTALPNSVSPTANLLPCVKAGVTVPGWSANPNDSGSCVAPLGQKCCNTYTLNGQPVCQAWFGSYDENAMNAWINACITPPSPDEINQRLAIANEYCQGNGIDLNYWSKNANNFVLVTTQDPGVPSSVAGENIRPFARMNNIPVWIVNTFTNMDDANKAKNDAVFSPTIQSTLKSTREDMMNASAALIKALSSYHSENIDEQKNIQQQLRSVEAKTEKLVSQSKHFDISLTDAIKVKMNTTCLKDNKKSDSKETFLGTSLLSQETDTRIQFESNYTFYMVFLIISIILFVIIFSNFFYTSSESSTGNDSQPSSTSYGMLFGIIAVLFFIYFIVQYLLARYNISRPKLPLESMNPLFVL